MLFVREFLRRRGKLLTLIVGFLFSTVGALWALLVTDRIDGQIQRLGERRSEIGRQIGALNRLASEYFIANQQGDLIFILKVQPDARPDLAADIYSANLNDRSVPVVNMISELGVEEQVDAAGARAAYERLNADAAADPASAEKFWKVKDFEKGVIMTGQKRVFELVEDNDRLDRELRSKQSTQSLNHILAVLTAIIGSAVLVAANVITEAGPPDAVAADPVMPAG